MSSPKKNDKNPGWMHKSQLLAVKGHLHSRFQSAILRSDGLTTIDFKKSEVYMTVLCVFDRPSKFKEREV